MPVSKHLYVYIEFQVNIVKTCLYLKIFFFVFENIPFYNSLTGVLVMG